MASGNQQTLTQAEPAGTYSPEKTDEVREGILRAIHEGVLVAGQRLVEASLCGMFGAGRGYVREALARLNTEGIVEIIPFRGARVRSFTHEEARNIDLTITALMALAARQAAGRIAEGDNADRLSDVMREMERFADNMDFMTYVAVRIRFYETIISISGNSEISRICPLLQGQMTKRQAWTNYDRQHHVERLMRYRAVHDALMLADGAAAEAAFWDTLIFERP